MNKIGLANLIFSDDYCVRTQLERTCLEVSKIVYLNTFYSHNPPASKRSDLFQLSGLERSLKGRAWTDFSFDLYALGAEGSE